MKWIIIILFFCNTAAFAQNLGGSFTYGFLKLSKTPSVTALGGQLVSLQSTDPTLNTQNPALLQANSNSQLFISFQNLYGGISHLNTAYGWQSDKLKANTQAGIQFVNYGAILLTNANGDVQGNLAANDYSAYYSISKSYLNRWQFGATTKFIGSNYGTDNSYALAIDAGLTYSDTAHLLQIGMLMKNIGVQLKPYTTGNGEPLPFDLQFGISKKLAKAPIQFVATITNAHQYNIRYADDNFDQEINGTINRGSFTIDKLFRHIILGVQLYASKQITASFAYNYLRRKELLLFNIGNGFTGFSFGGGYTIKGYNFQYAQSYYQNNTPTHQIGLSIDFNKLMMRK